MAWHDLKKYPLSTKTCTVYLIHFSRPFKHAKHYIGVTTNGVDQRFAEHKAGRGAKLTKAAVAVGIELHLAKVWRDVPRYTELKLKNMGGAKRICPICKGKHLEVYGIEDLPLAHLADVA